jgi:hypothetical protein
MADAPAVTTPTQPGGAPPEPKAPEAKAPQVGEPVDATAAGAKPTEVLKPEPKFYERLVYGKVE